MNREIRFRAWHIETKTMYWFDIMNGNAHGTGSGYISMCPIGESITKVKHKDNMTAVDPAVCEIMQFTGLEDKNGNPIYEGDYFEVANNKVYQIKWMNDGESNYERYCAMFVLWLNEETFFPLDDYAMKSGRVIGNIYEHESPELLKGDNTIMNPDRGTKH